MMFGRALTAFSLLLGLTAIGTAAAAQTGNSTAAAARRWTLDTPRNPAKAQISVLASVACSSGRACTAVGSSSYSLSSPTLTLAERWSGGHWRIQRTPTRRGATSDTFYGVSCPSARRCVAVGNAFHTAGRRQTTLIEAWNGRRWHVQSAPRAGRFPSLYSVSCASASSCMAAGGYNALRGPQATVERWNGRTWRIGRVPRPAASTEFLGVSCAGARACFAVGYENAGTGNARPLAETWNGTRWRIQRVPLPHGAPGGVLDAVSCTSPRACTATGTDFAAGGPTLAERWNGRSWRVQPTPSPANYRTSVGDVSLDGVSCSSSRACTASGEYSPGGAAAYFVESWNGGRWRIQPTPQPAGFERGALLGVSCVPARCAAVGAYTGRVRLQVTLAMTR